MAKKNKKATRKAVSKKKRVAWQFIPFYGLTIEQDDGLHEPIFGDATLVSPSSVEQEARASGSEVHPILLHKPFSETFGDEQWKTIPLPRHHLLEIPPHAFIGVRNREGFDQTLRRADTIRAFLTATLVLRAGRLAAFASEPRHIAWYMAPRNIAVERSKPAQSSYRVVMNEHVINRPLRVQKEELRNSWKTGSITNNQDKLQWDIHSEHPVSVLLIEKNHGRRRGRLINAALQLQQACCTSPYSVQLQMAVTAIELLLYTNNFKKLQERMYPFFRRDVEHEKISQILDTRHNLTHSSVNFDDKETKSLAGNALRFAWLLFDVAVGYLDSFQSAEEYERFLEAQASASLLDKEVAGMADGLSSGPIISVFDNIFSKSRKCNLTNRWVTGTK